jgi:tetratricopeptide (TPR) repeat protein
MLPNHPLVLERLADIDAAAQGGGRVSHSGPFPVVGGEPPSSKSQADHGDGEFETVRASTDRPGYPPELVPVRQQVRAGVRAEVADTDAATHYDLGVAYLEMGLDQDAISELTLAARDPRRECVCLSMIATIHLKLGDADAALDALQRAFKSPEKTHEQELRVGYEIANTYEVKGMPDQALYYFEWLANLEPNYEDPRGSVSERIERLRTESGAQPRPQAPLSGADPGDLDSALDDLFGERS